MANAAIGLVALEGTLKQLDLQRFLRELQGLGVAQLSDVPYLQVKDLEEIELNRVQTRKLQRAAEEAPKPEAVPPTDLQSTLTQFDLQRFSPELQGLGVAQLSDVLYLQDDDLKEIGFNKVETRKLQRAAEEAPKPEAVPIIEVPRIATQAWLDGGDTSTENRAGGKAENVDERSVVMGRSAAARGRSVSFCARARSASSHPGLEVEQFEQRCTDAIVSFATRAGRGCEIASRELGIKEADLVIRVTENIPFEDLLPAVFIVRPSKRLERSVLHSGSVIIFEAKTSSRGAHRAIAQLRNRQQAVQERLEAPASASTNPARIVVHMAAIIAVSPNDNASTETLNRCAADHSDIYIVSVNPDELEEDGTSFNAGKGTCWNYGEGKGWPDSQLDEHWRPALSSGSTSKAAGKSYEAGTGKATEFDTKAVGKPGEGSKGRATDLDAKGRGKLSDGGKDYPTEWNPKGLGKPVDGGTGKAIDWDAKAAGKASDGCKGVPTEWEAKGMGKSGDERKGKGNDGSKGKFQRPPEGVNDAATDKREKLQAKLAAKADREGRQEIGNEWYFGEVVWLSGTYGWIVPERPWYLPVEVQQAMSTMADEQRSRPRRRKASKHYNFAEDALYFDLFDRSDPHEIVVEGMRVSFKVYLDRMGAGAYDAAPVPPPSWRGVADPLVGRPHTSPSP